MWNKKYDINGLTCKRDSQLRKQTWFPKGKEEKTEE